MIASGIPPVVVPATTDDVDTVAAVLAAVQQDKPVARWAASDPRERRLLLRAWYTILAERALVHGAVDLLADRRGAAVWLDRTQPLPDPLDYERRLVTECGLSGLDMLMVEHVGSHHRIPVQHSHLTHIGVDQGEHRRQRLGALLEHRHALLDAAGVLAAAEASTDAELDLFGDYCYRLAEPYVLPGGPQVGPLLRIPPRSDRRPGPARSCATPANRRDRSQPPAHLVPRSMACTGGPPHAP
jgi:hypothetical protein